MILYALSEHDHALSWYDDLMAARRRRSGRRWIQGAIKRPGAFRAKAKRARMSTSAYANKVTRKGSRASTRTKRQANLAKTLGKMRKRRRR